MKKTSEKYNESCIKIFDMLKLLSGGTANYEDIINLFSTDDNSETSSAHVVLNKYLNTLKIFGINIHKSKNVYYLQNSFFTLNLTKEDIKALKLLKSSNIVLSNAKQKSAFLKFIKDIEMRLSNTTREIYNTEDSNSNKLINDYLLKHKDIIEKCETFCSENHKIEVCFTQENKDYKLICNPREISYINQKAYLTVFNHLSRQVFEVPIDCITSIKQMPLLTTGKEVPITIVYQIRGNLAKAYRLREWETTDGKIDSEGWLTIINNNEDLDVLTKRLLRYDTNCRVLSPKSFKDRMLTMIDSTLANYE